MKKSITGFLLTAFLFSAGLYAQNVTALDKNVEQITDEGIHASNMVQLAMSNPDYIVTAGDVYSLNYTAGSSTVSYTIPVDSTYKIRVSNLAVIDAKNKTYVALKREVENIVMKNYPMSGVQFVLSKPASFKVVVTGEVKNTMERDAWSLARVSTVVKSGITPYSSSRNITIKSADGSTKNVDLFKAFRFGDFTQDPYLRPGDTVILNKIDRRVTLNGAVERPGTYELLPGENLNKLISYYGNGLAPLADPTRIEVTRNLSETNKSGEKLYLNKEELDKVQKDFDILSYDTVTVYSYSNLKPVIFVEGAIAVADKSTNSGTELISSNRAALNFNNGENYAYFIRNHNNLFTSVSDTEHAYILRNGKIIPVNLNQMLYDASYYSDLTVEDNDILTVPFRQFFVTVAGAVKNPGRYSYIPDRSYEYYVSLAGGFDTDRNKNKAVEMFDINGKELSVGDSIPPEATISVKSNSGLYFFNKFAPVITTVLSLVTTTISVVLTAKSLTGGQ